MRLPNSAPATVTISAETEAPQAARLRRLLRAELSLAADQVPYLCTLLRVPDESWQDAVEGLLGHNRFHLLVPAEHYDAAMRLYHRRRHKDSLHGVGLLDEERLLANGRPVQPGTPGRPRSRPTTPPPVPLSICFSGATHECESLEDLRDHRTAVTRDCFVRRNYATSHLDPRVYRRWFIGERAIPRQIEQREERLADIGQELAGLQVRFSGLARRLALTRDKVRPICESGARPAGRRPLSRMESHLAGLRSELAGLDTRSVDTLRAEVERQQARVERAADPGGQPGARASAAWKSERPRWPTRHCPAWSETPTTPSRKPRALCCSRTLRHCWTRRRRSTSAAASGSRWRRSCPTPTATKTTTRLRKTAAATGCARPSRPTAWPTSLATTTTRTRPATSRERDKFVESELPGYEQRIARQRALAEQELVENFIHRLREQIEEARQQLGYLNTTLSALRFGGERFEFITRPEPSLRQVYDLIMDSQAVLGASLFDSDFRQRHQQGWDLLFERLTTGTVASMEDAVQELRELQDYRNYLQYDIRIHYPNGDRALLSQISAKKSGGETTTPFYVAMAASFAQAYRLTQPRHADTIRLALFDEAFGKMDTARTASALQFMVDSQLQVLLATPPDKAAGLLPHVDSVRTVVRKNNHSFVIEIDKSEMLKQLEADAEPA